MFIVYPKVAPVFGFLGDRFSRKYIMAAGEIIVKIHNGSR